jgi:hypothetical protein
MDQDYVAPHAASLLVSVVLQNLAIYETMENFPHMFVIHWVIHCCRLIYLD